MIHNNSVSTLFSYSSLEDAITDILKISKSALKKSTISKKNLKNPVNAKDGLYIPIELLNINMVNPVYEGPIQEIIFENDLFLVLNKPSNIHCHPLTYLDKQNIISQIRQSHPSLLAINKNEHEKGLLYRLDQVTSGVLVYVKNEQILNKLRANYSTLISNKQYLAIVHGEFEIQGKTEFYLKPYGKKGSKILTFDEEGEGTQKASQKITPLAYNSEQNLSLVQINLHTGIRHQIRTTLSHLGHPILGDTLYNGRSSDRVYLHAYKYEINYKKTYSFTAKPNNLFQTLFDRDISS